MIILKKIGLTLFVVLLLVSIFKDLTVGTIVRETETVQGASEKDNEEQPVEKKNKKADENTEKEQQKETNRYKVVSKKVAAGETVLSIVETINPDENSLLMKQIILDFETLNPGIDPHLIEPNKEYYFPAYKN
ncbi:hypothetical protein [Aquibacillus kalidii]|uniref:hypothetical protein n=1 Tax=Aquibacillus kalidii TaxID=2762597 RepID=UPI001644C19D|nr:hypothetical protein [Aquibacillus kalidii]